MRLRKQDYGVDFPADREAANAAQEGVENDCLAMESILLDPLEARGIRFALGQAPEIREIVKSHQLVEPESIGVFVDVLKSARRDELKEERRRKIDKIVSKCREWERKGLPIFVDV